MTTKRHLSIAKDYQDIFNSPQGKRVFADLMIFCKALKSTFVQGDSHGSALLEGQRNVALYIISKLNVDILELTKVLLDYEKEIIHDRPTSARTE